MENKGLFLTSGESLHFEYIYLPHRRLHLNIAFLLFTYNVLCLRITSIKYDACLSSCKFIIISMCQSTFRKHFRRIGKNTRPFKINVSRRKWRLSYSKKFRFGCVSNLIFNKYYIPHVFVCIHFQTFLLHWIIF